MYRTSIELTKKPATEILIIYNQMHDTPRAPFMVTDMYHSVVLPNDGAILTNMAHLIMDVMTSELFAPLKTRIEQEIERQRKTREILIKRE